MFWMPVEDPVFRGDQVRHDELGTFYEAIMFWSLNIVICDLFVIWCLEFVILDTKLQGKTLYL